MKEQLNNDYFFEKYPSLFSHAKKEKAFYCGASCGMGWKDLIDQCFNLVIKHVEVTNLYAKSEEDKLDVKILQLKSKFASLRIYINGGDEYIKGVISMAETVSYSTCEHCGTNQNVSQNRNGWIQTLCQECRKENP